MLLTFGLAWHLELLTRVPFLSFFGWLSTTLFSHFPAWFDATRCERLLFPLTPLWLPLMEGAWWTFFRWFQAQLTSLSLPQVHLPVPRSYLSDVRFWFPTSLDVTLTGWSTLPWSRLRKRPRSNINHHQFGIHVRLRCRRVPLYTAPAVPADLATQQTTVTSQVPEQSHEDETDSSPPEPEQEASQEVKDEDNWECDTELAHLTIWTDWTSENFMVSRNRPLGVCWTSSYTL